MEYHVSKSGSNQNPGTYDKPFLTINKAASIAKPGDVVVVHEGVYRECVNPKNKGLSSARSITYKAAVGEHAVIKGSERIVDWERLHGTVWKAVIPNSFFGDYNPYVKEIFGDWLVTIDKTRHLGDVYLNGMSFYEADSLEEVMNPEIRTESFDYWTEEKVVIKNPEQTKYMWFSECDSSNTTIYANFHGADPREELTEINVRQSCFYPSEIGIDYIVVQSFEMAHAATPWAPPTADQPGLICTNWSKGWIIENNIIHDSKCSAISIGKEATTGNNYCSIRRDKPGYQYQLESVFSAKQAGWSKEKIGSHIIRNNTIYDCGQNAIVGHLGCVFSQIYNNHIYNIALKREFYGHEIAGIKLHAAIDVQIFGNRIHDCTLGLWLDWQAQGTRVSRNLLYDNTRDLFVEVSHGPYTVDHNIFASQYSLDNHSQGGAYINNLFNGKIYNKKILNRSTQYHVPHSTDVAGFAFTYGGDDRFYNNIFVGDGSAKYSGTSYFDNYPESLEEYIAEVSKQSGDLEVFELVEQLVYINNNVYLNGAQPYKKEKDFLLFGDFNPEVKIVDEEESVFVSLSLPKGFTSFSNSSLSAMRLPQTRITDADFENPDGSEIVFDRDYFNQEIKEAKYLGPLESIKEGTNYIKVV